VLEADEMRELLGERIQGGGDLGVRDHAARHQRVLLRGTRGAPPLDLVDADVDVDRLEQTATELVLDAVELALVEHAESPAGPVELTVEGQMLGLEARLVLRSAPDHQQQRRWKE
jgi:hypothetical protein